MTYNIIYYKVKKKTKNTSSLGLDVVEAEIWVLYCNLVEARVQQRTAIG